MAFTLLGDEFADDADMAELSDAAYRTHVDALVWSSSRLLDLEIPKKDLARFAFSEQREDAAVELVKADWWLDHGDHWTVIKRSEWQWTSAQHAARKVVNRRAQRHRRGDHRDCIAGKCSALSADVSAADIRVDVSADVSADVGEERQGQALKKPPTTKVNPASETQPTEPNVYGVGECKRCGGYEPLIKDRMCSDCLALPQPGQVGHAS